MSEWETFCSGITECRRCFTNPSYHEARKFTDIPLWKDNPKLAVIGEAPSLRRMHQGLTFGARSKPIFEAFLREMGLTRNDCFTTNLVKCTIPKVTQGYPDKCYPWLLEELTLVNCKYIILMGRIVVETILNTNVRLDGKPIVRGVRVLFPVKHPMHASYRPADFESYMETAKKIRRTIDDLEQRPLESWTQ